MEKENPVISNYQTFYYVQLKKLVYLQWKIIIKKKYFNHYNELKYITIFLIYNFCRAKKLTLNSTFILFLIKSKLCFSLHKFVLKLQAGKALFHISH